ncbi:MAG: NADP-dependent phosphogluconate dehydrogenase [Deltaproteobacteria bacterium]|nr:NADP-dependent phosphogluconate dehydrogenase [Deltaproteobacteria bacterium]
MGVMGANLARNFASRGLPVAIQNRTRSVADEVAASHPEARFVVASSVVDLVSRLSRPRRVVLMLTAGAATDSVIAELAPHLESGDVVVDAGNSHPSDTDRRNAAAKGQPWRFVGMGVSGGAEGALRGPSIMPGGDPEVWEGLRPLLEAIAARSDSGVCVTHCGLGSAGHFVKMVHNGIEYGDMQLIAESAMLLRAGLGLSPGAVADTFGAWNGGRLGSFLIEITADIFRVEDERNPGALLLDAIEDKAGQKGTGRWTVDAASALGVPIPTIAAAVDARGASAKKPTRLASEIAYRPIRGPVSGVSADDVADALYASKIASYTQGFALLAAASEANGYGTSLSEVARIWTAGCIIRAAFLDRVRAAFSAEPAPELLSSSPDFVAEISRCLPSWRRVAAAALTAGHPIPALAASLTWFDTLTLARGSANLIQAQRDYFGSHTYERVDEPGVVHHTDWDRARRLGR